MLVKTKKSVVLLFVVILVSSCGGGSGSGGDPDLNISDATGSIKFSAIEDDTSTMTVPLSYMISPTESFEEEFRYLKVYIVNKTQKVIFVDYPADYYFEDSEEQLFFFTLPSTVIMDVYPVAEGDEVAIIFVHSDESWEKYVVTVREDESVSVSPYSGDEAYAQNELDDYTSAEELWCFIHCLSSCSEDEELSYRTSETETEGVIIIPSSYTDGVCPEE